MLKIPDAVRDMEIITSLATHMIGQGKVRDMHAIPDVQDAGLMVATDRVGAFDFVLPAIVPKKGEVLTALTHFWLTFASGFGLTNHLLQVATEGKPENTRNLARSLKDKYPDIDLGRTLAIRFAVEVLPYELIFRHHIGGSVYESYLKGGYPSLPDGLPKWSKLSSPLFTPSTKAVSGHDINISALEFRKTNGHLGDACVDLTGNLYVRAYKMAENRGILILDTKMEAGFLKCDRRHERVYAKPGIVDEVLTPDSSRFVDKEDWERAMRDGKDPEFLDKESLRKYLKTIPTPFKDENGKEIVGIHKLDPTNPRHLAFVESLEIPDEVINDMTSRYLEICRRITGCELDEYQMKWLL